MRFTYRNVLGILGGTEMKEFLKVMCTIMGGLFIFFGIIFILGTLFWFVSELTPGSVSNPNSKFSEEVFEPLCLEHNMTFEKGVISMGDGCYSIEDGIVQKYIIRSINGEHYLEARK